MSHWQYQRKRIQIFDFTEELLSFKEISNYPVQNRVVDLRILIWLHLKVKYFRFLDTEVLTDCWDFSHCGCSNITEWDNPSFTSNHYHLPRHQHNQWLLIIIISTTTITKIIIFHSMIKMEKWWNSVLSNITQWESPTWNLFQTFHFLTKLWNNNSHDVPICISCMKMWICFCRMHYASSFFEALPSMSFYIFATFYSGPLKGIWSTPSFSWIATWIWTLYILSQNEFGCQEHLLIKIYAAGILIKVFAI